MDISPNIIHFIISPCCLICPSHCYLSPGYRQQLPNWSPCFHLAEPTPLLVYSQHISQGNLMNTQVISVLKTLQWLPTSQRAKAKVLPVSEFQGLTRLVPHVSEATLEVAPLALTERHI